MAQSRSASGTKKNTSAKKKARKPIRREVGSVVCLALGLFTLIGYFVRDYWLIDWLCLYVFKGLFGWGFLVVPLCFLWAAAILGFHRGRPVAGRIVALSFIPLLFGAAVHLLVCKTDYGFDWLSIRSLYYGGINLETGGVVSGLLSIFLERAVSVYGALPVFIIALFSVICVAGKVSLRERVEDMKNRPRAEYEPMPEPVPEKPRAKKERGTPRERAQELPAPEIFAVPEPANASAQPQESGSGGIFSRRRKKAAIDIPIEDEPLPEEPIPDMPQGILYQGQPDMAAVADCIRRGEEKRAKNRRSTEEDPFIENAAPAEEEPFIENAVSAEEEPFIEETAPAEDLSLEDGSAEIGIESVREPVPFVKPEKLRREDVDAAADEIAQTIEETEQMPEYQYPPVTLLKAGDGITSDGREEVSLNRERLETTLHSFGIGASVTEITRGPTVTRYDLELEAGVKLSKLTNLAGDLALSLGVVSVRIAPIPDKISTVGVEVPNKVVSTVYLRDIIDSPAFQNAASKLSFAIGKDIGGNCIVGNIAKLPHMLIAGTTGSGKSVCMNSLILSLLYKATPDEVRLIMIDPKMVELGIYNGIPHLYIPVVTDPKKAAGSLQWAVVEMMKRYRLFSEIGVRDLKGYNTYKTRLGEPTIPSVVIVIDELADLMMTAAKERKIRAIVVYRLDRIKKLKLLDEKFHIPYSSRFDEGEFRKRIQNQTILEVCRKMPVKKGDVFYIPAGLLHAIGAGITVAEIQQSSDVTYRVYDYNRENANHEKRPLHIEKAALVAGFMPPLAGHRPMGPHIRKNGYSRTLLVQCPYFVVQLYEISESVAGDTAEGFQSLLILEGEGVLKTSFGEMSLKAGDSIYLPQETGDYQIIGTLQLLRSTAE